MTYEQNVKAILETNFSGFKEEIIDIACKLICMLETKKETIDRVLEIVDRYIVKDPYASNPDDNTANHRLMGVWKEVAAMKVEEEMVHEIDEMLQKLKQPKRVKIKDLPDYVPDKNSIYELMQEWIYVDKWVRIS